jgi:RAB protein geranylgeranyltransferase component A
MNVPRPFIHIQTAQSKSKFGLPSFSQLVQSVFGEFNYLVIVSQLMTLEDPAELICTDGSALAVMFLGSSIKQSAFIHVNLIGRRKLVFPSGIKVIYSFTASKAILFNARYIFVHIETKIVEWVYVQ